MSGILLSPPTIVPPPARTRPSLVEVLVIGGCAVAPLNLLLVRSFTVYDGMIGVALLILLYRRELRMPPMRYLVAGYVFLLAGLISAFRATYPVEALTQLVTYGFIFFVQIPVVISVVRTRMAVVVSLALICMGTLAAVLHAYLNQNTQGAGRVLIFYSDNPNRLGYPAAYLLPLLIVLGLLVWKKRPSARLVTLAAAIGGGYLAVWALTASASRSALVGSLVALVVLVVLRPGLGVARIVLRAALLAAAVYALAMVLISTGQMPTTLEDRIERSLSGEGDDQHGLVGDREQLNKAGVRAFVDSPYVGTGLDNFRYVTVDYNLDATSQIPHNLELQLLVQVGVFGALAFLGLLVMWLCDMVRAYKSAAPEDRQLLWGLVSALAGVLAISQFMPEMLDRNYWLMLALGLAVADGVNRHHREVVPT